MMSLCCCSGYLYCNPSNSVLSSSSDYLKTFPYHAYQDPRIANQDYYDLVILDIKMPKMNGFEVYAEMLTITRSSFTGFYGNTKQSSSCYGAYFLRRRFIPFYSQNNNGLIMTDPLFLKTKSQYMMAG
jgi:hypothetical protein